MDRGDGAGNTLVAGNTWPAAVRTHSIVVSREGHNCQSKFALQSTRLDNREGSAWSAVVGSRWRLQGTHLHV